MAGSKEAQFQQDITSTMGFSGLEAGQDLRADLDAEEPRL